MSTSTISNTFPTTSLDSVLATITSFVTNPFNSGQPILTLRPISVFLYNIVQRHLRPDSRETLHPHLRPIPDLEFETLLFKYTGTTHTLIVKHPYMPHHLREVFPNFIFCCRESFLQIPGVLTLRELKRVQFRSGQIYTLPDIGSKQADLEIRYNRKGQDRTIPHIIFEVRMGQQYESIKCDVREWLVATQGEVKLGVLVYYDGGNVHDWRTREKKGADGPKTQDGYISPVENFAPDMFFFETYRYIKGDIELVQGRTYLYRDGERVTPEPIFELSRCDFELPGSEDKDGDGDGEGEGEGEGENDTVGTEDQGDKSKIIYRIPLGKLQDWIETGVAWIARDNR